MIQLHSRLRLLNLGSLDLLGLHELPEIMSKIAYECMCAQYAFSQGLSILSADSNPERLRIIDYCNRLERISLTLI